MRLYHFIGLETPVVALELSRIAPQINLSATGGTNYDDVDDTDGNSVDCSNSGGNNIFIIVKNEHASNTLTVTQIPATRTYAGLTLSSETIVIAALSEAIIGPIDHNFMLEANLARFSFSGTAPNGRIMAFKCVANDT